MEKKIAQLRPNELMIEKFRHERHRLQQQQCICLRFDYTYITSNCVPVFGAYYFQYSFINIYDELNCNPMGKKKKKQMLQSYDKVERNKRLRYEVWHIRNIDHTGRFTQRFIELQRNEKKNHTLTITTIADRGMKKKMLSAKPLTNLLTPIGLCDLSVSDLFRGSCQGLAYTHAHSSVAAKNDIHPVERSFLILLTHATPQASL